MDKNNKKKENQVENLVTLAQKHTRTERHLEQYSDIGSKENKEKAREKQQVREEEIKNLKDKIVFDNNESKVEQFENLSNNYKETQSYMEDNYENIAESDLENLQEKQQNREIQKENLAKNIFKKED